MPETQFHITDEKRDYSAFGLTENPFPYSPVPDDDPAIYCGQEQVVEDISSTISTVLATGKSKHLVVTGKYGNGKSHTLKYSRSLIRNREDVVVGYVPKPGEGFQDIYHEFMYDLGFDRVRDLAYEFLMKVTTEVTDFEPQSPQEMATAIDEGDVLLSEIVPQAIEKLNGVTKFADFSRAIIHMVYEDTRLYAWQWLTAEGIRYEQRKEMEIHSSLGDDTASVRAFTSLRNLLREIGYTAVFVFVDEFEAIARLSPKEKQSTLNSIRHLMDQNSHGLCVMFGCAPEVWQEVMSEYHAFSERIGKEVALRPLTTENIHALISKYLDTARNNPGNHLEPFNDETLELILRRSQGNIRQVLYICSIAIDEGVDQRVEEINNELIKSALGL